MNETWKDIVGYEGLYQISSKGNVRSFYGDGRLLAPKKNSKGYLWYALYKKRVATPFLAHRLVAIHFIDNPYGYPILNHIDENPRNNQVDNLEWCTNSYNILYSLKKSGRKQRTSYHRTSGVPYKTFSKIAQLDLCGNFVQTWNSCVQIKHELHINESSIRDCCKGKRKTAYGFKWVFIHENTPLEKAV